MMILESVAQFTYQANRVKSENINHINRLTNHQSGQLRNPG